jgi:hypothetical protein
VLHNYARDRQHHKDDLLLLKVDDEIEPIDDANLITSVQVLLNGTLLEVSMPMTCLMSTF